MHYGVKSDCKHKTRASISSTWWEFERWQYPSGARQESELGYFNRENLMWETSHAHDWRPEEAIRGQ